MNRILVLQLERTGDLIQTTPFLREFQEANPKVAVDLLILEENCSVLDGFPGIATLRTIPEKTVIALNQEVEACYPKQETPIQAQKLFSELQLPHYSKVFNFTHQQFGCWLSEQIPADDKEGGAITADGEWLYRGDWHVYLVAFLDFRERNAFNLVDLYRGSGPQKREPKSGDRLFVAKDSHFDAKLPVGIKIALNPGASSPKKRWPAKHFVQLVSLLQREGATPILVGSGVDQPICVEIEKACSGTLLNFAGKTTIPQMASLLSQVNLLVSNDTGAMHIAAAVGTPVIGLAGVEVFFRETGPWGEGHLVLQAPLGDESNSLEFIPPELAHAAVQFRLGKITRSDFNARLSQANQVEAWESGFLPEGLDPLGGVSYQPIFTRMSAEQRAWSEVLRSVFARSMSSKQATWKASAVRDALSSRNQIAAELGKAREGTQKLIEVCREVTRIAKSGPVSKIQQLGSELEAGLEEALRHHKKGSWLHPIFNFQHWQLKMVEPGDLASVFREHEVVLSQTLRFLDSALRELKA